MPPRAGAMRAREAEELIEEIDRLARNTLRWGADAAEATFREVVAQGPEKTLGRGFAVVHSATGQIVTSAAAASERPRCGCSSRTDPSMPRCAGARRRAMSDRKTFKEAYAILQKHAQTLRSQQEPDIDNLTTIVSESVAASQGLQGAHRRRREGARAGARHRPTRERAEQSVSAIVARFARPGAHGRRRAVLSEIFRLGAIEECRESPPGRIDGCSLAQRAHRRLCQTAFELVQAFVRHVTVVSHRLSWSGSVVKRGSSSLGYHRCNRRYALR